MYSRRIDDQTYTFEASGGLLNATLVLMDEETDSYWSIMTDKAIMGPARGTKLEKIPGAVRTTWGEWRALHPDTMVLSIDGKEHTERNPYENYFASKDSFKMPKPGGEEGERIVFETDDDRLGEKDPVYAFRLQETPYAIAHTRLADGVTVEVGGQQVFLYRAADDPIDRSTYAFVAQPGSRFERQGDAWHLAPQGVAWNPQTRRFGDGPVRGVEVLDGFDTFWYSWRLTNENTELL